MELNVQRYEGVRPSQYSPWRLRAPPTSKKRPWLGWRRPSWAATTVRLSCAGSSMTSRFLQNSIMIGLRRMACRRFVLGSRAPRLASASRHAFILLRPTNFTHLPHCLAAVVRNFVKLWNLMPASLAGVVANPMAVWSVLRSWHISLGATLRSLPEADASQERWFVDHDNL